MINILPYRRGDALRVNLRPEYHEPDSIKILNDRLAGFHNVIAWTLYVGSRVEGCVFGTILWPGVMEVTALFSVELIKKPKEFFKRIKVLLESQIAINGLHRVQMVCRVGFSEAINLAKHLGFKSEGRMYKFFESGEDAFMMARVV